MMRLLIDTLILFMLVALLGGITWHRQREYHRQQQIEAVRHAMNAITAQSLYRAAVGDAPASPSGYAMRIEREWFNPLPHNVLIRADVPWMQTVKSPQSHRVNPRNIVAGHGRAEFWYAPYQGVIRARVPMQLSHQATVALYNRVNDTSVRAQALRWTYFPDTANADSTANQSSVEQAPQKPVDPLVRDFATSP